MTLRRVLNSFICLLVFALSASLAHATTWMYTFSGTNTAPGGDGLSVGFQYSSPQPITENTSLSAPQLTSCVNCQTIPGIPAVTFQLSSLFGSFIDFGDILSNGSSFRFPFGAFVNPGTYISGTLFNPGSLTLQLEDKTSVSSNAALEANARVAPEPNTIVLLFGGCACILLGIKRKSKAVRSAVAVHLPRRLLHKAPVLHEVPDSITCSSRN